MLLVQGSAHCFVLLLVWMFTPTPLYGWLLAVAVVVSALSSLWRYRHPVATALHLGKAGVIEVETVAGSRDSATILPQTTVLSGLIVLLLRLGGRTAALSLPADATGTEAHRQLRLWLRWQATLP